MWLSSPVDDSDGQSCWICAIIFIERQGRCPSRCTSLELGRPSCNFYAAMVLGTISPRNRDSVCDPIEISRLMSCHKNAQRSSSSSNIQRSILKTHYFAGHLIIQQITLPFGNTVHVSIVVVRHRNSIHPITFINDDRQYHTYSYARRSRSYDDSQRGTNSHKELHCLV